MKKRKRKILATNAFGISQEPKDERYSRRVGRKRTIERYFSGYEYEYIVKENGREKVVRRYTGDIFRQKISAKEFKKIRIMHAIFAILSVCCFVLSLILDTESNRCWYVMLTMLFPLVAYIRSAFVLMAYLPSKQDLREYEYYDGAQHVVKSSRLTAIAVIILILSTLWMMISAQFLVSWLEYLRIVLLGIASAGMLIIADQESRVEYEFIPGKCDC